MVVGNVVKWLGLALVGAFLFMSVADPSRASATVSTLRSGGPLLSTYGTGIRDLFEGIGTGAAKLLNPFWTLRDLIYGPQAGAQVDTAVRESVSTGQAITASGIIANVEDNPSEPFDPGNTHYDRFQNAPLSVPFYTDTSISPVPVANVSVHGQNVPLSQAAISYYQNLGVTVSPQNAQTVASQNSSNANSSNSASTNASASHTATTPGSGANFGGQPSGGRWSGGGFRAAN